MKIGLGLPIGAPEQLLTWARLADAGPFSTLGLLDRLVYDNPEPLVTLAAVAGATSRVRVQTEVLLAPLRDTPLLAKQAATLHRISGGRFTLGLGVGDRDDDHLAAGRDRHTRGRRLDDQMATLHRIWAGAPYTDTVGPIGPAPTSATPPPAPRTAPPTRPPAAPESAGSEGATSASAAPESAGVEHAGGASTASEPAGVEHVGGASAGSEVVGVEHVGGASARCRVVGVAEAEGASAGPGDGSAVGWPEVLFGAFAPAALDRVARWGDGYLCAAPAEWAGRLIDHVERSWAAAGRAGRPRIVAQVNAVLGGERVVAGARHAITAYYGPGNPRTRRIADGLLATPAAVRTAMAAFADLGVDELMLYCWATDPGQVERLTDAVS